MEDPLTHDPISRIIFARTDIHNNAARIPLQEMGERLDFILNLENPVLVLHQDDVALLRDALVERGAPTEETFMNRINDLFRDRWNLTMAEGQFGEMEDLGGSRTKRKKSKRRRSRKYRR